jgi:fibronectin-binding autotransporter adhesin
MSSAAVLLFCHAPSAQAETWAPGAGGSWATPGNWTPATVPNAISATAIFNSPTATRTVTIDSGTAGFTVGSISSDISGSFGNAFNTGTTGSKLILDNGGAGVTITTTGTGTGNNAFAAPWVLNDSVNGIVNQPSTASAAGSLNITAAVSGIGGFTKSGDGLATFGSGGKTYTGATVLSGGRMRMSLLASPTATSSFTINAGGQLTLISAGSYTFGSGPLNLNGAGPTSGPYAAFPGAIRNDTSLVATINNSVVLQSDTVIHVQGSATGSTTLSGTVTGPGKLTLTAIPHDANLGVLALNGANTYAGGTVVDGGTLLISGAGASLGSGNVAVHSAGAAFAGATAKLTIQAGVLDAIADTAILSLDGGGSAGVADDGIADLGAGVNESVGYLVLGGVTQVPGTYGSTSSAATFQNDEYFAGIGIITALLPRPLLAIELSAPNVLLSWPTNAVGFVLQGVGALTDVWADDNTPSVISGTNYTVTETAPTNKFFRLKK